MPVLSALNALTVADIIRDALLDLGAIGAEDTLSAADVKDGMRRLNRMLDAWNAERLTVYSVKRETFPVVNGKASYSIGPGGDFDTTRPPKLEFARWIDAGGNEYLVQVLTVEEWNRLSPKSTTADRVTGVYYDPTYPLGTVNTFPVPNGTTGTLVLGTWQQFSKFTSSIDPVQFPPAYEEAIVSHLTIRLAPSYGKSASAETVQLATKAKANLKRMNSPTLKLRCDEALTGRGCYDIHTGGWIR